MASLPHSHKVLSLGLSAVLLLSGTQALAVERITCESKNYRYHRCNVDTDNRVKLKQQLSNAPCIEGQTWGYDKKGIWVNQGCAAEFKVGKDKDDNKGGLGAAAVGVGALAILGALMGGGGTGGDTSSYPPAGSNYPPAGSNYPYNPPGYPSQGPNYSYNQPGSYVPDWAIGTFRGNNPQYNTDIELTISPTGQVNGYAGNEPVQGYFRNNQIRIGNLTLQVQPENQGFRTFQAGNPDNKVRYFRVR